MTTAELFNKHTDDISTSLMDYEGFKKALTEHDIGNYIYTKKPTEEMQANQFESQVDVKTADIDKKYHELLLAVERKFPTESRHQTALRYIKEAEKVDNLESGKCDSRFSD